jgi:hypothetical protein
LFVHPHYKLNFIRKNVSNIDKSIRVFIALAVALLYYFDSIEGTLANILTV